MSTLMEDNIKRWTAERKAALVQSYCLQQGFINPYSPEQNGMLEREIRTLKKTNACTASVGKLGASPAGAGECNGR